jgi:hypothetical protein
MMSFFQQVVTSIRNFKPSSLNTATQIPLTKKWIELEKNEKWD